MVGAIAFARVADYDRGSVIGTILGKRYRVIALLGQGGMGAVYDAEDGETGERVAVKLITGEFARNDTIVGRFEHERRVAGVLDSPHITRLLDSGSEDGRPFMVMERLVGEDLGELLTRLGRLTEEVVLRIAVQTCRGLATAHEAGVVHRDIKPANLYLTKGAGDERLVKLLDFGIAKVKLDWATSCEAGGLTRTGTILGSPHYMSPEQARGGRAVDRRADIWSLGVVLYRALSGRVPNEEVTALGELIISICTQPSTPLSTVAPWVSPAAVAIVERALALDPGARFQTATEFLAALAPLVPDAAIREADLAAPRVSMPLPPSWPVVPTSPPTTVSPRARSGVTKRERRRVLIVEDNEMNMDMLARRLEKKGFTVLRATDGDKGVAVCTAELPDVVLMDLSLPGKDGWAATRELRGNEATRRIPIIALTAHAMTADRERALEVGCDDYETKPLEFPRLLAKIEAALRRAC